MKNLFVTVVLTAFSLITLHAQSVENLPNILGTWEVDLRPSPDSEPFIQYLVITEISGTSLKGTFYESSLEDGLVNEKFDSVFLAFTTNDQSSTYYHFIKLIDGNRIEGLTYSRNRNLIQPWKGRRIE
ncbi:hypothetical protein [Cyclobacterium xiamenense]|uniref:hypothetical protein n=1 Tax=Cyclobacterium xiamenense TaxID=1297121 RepID=UPI0035CEC612